MIANDYIITAAEGIHARPAANLIKLARQFKSAVSLKKDDRTIKLNSVLNILTMAAKGGETITIIVDGEDEAAASAAIGHFFKELLKDL